MIEYALVAVIVIGLFGIGYVAGGGEGPRPPPPGDDGCCLRVPDDPRELIEDGWRGDWELDRAFSEAWHDQATSHHSEN
jgi:hypothetical protein